MLLQVTILVQQTVLYNLAAQHGGDTWQIILGVAYRVVPFAFIPLQDLSLIHIQMCIRDRGYADEVVIVTSGEKMALYAAANIKKALDNFQERGYAKLRGIVLNCRNVPDEVAIVEDFVQRIGTEIIGVVPRDSDIQRAEEQNMTVVQMDSELPVSQTIIDIAKRIMVPVEEQKEGAV